MQSDAECNTMCIPKYKAYVVLVAHHEKDTGKATTIRTVQGYQIYDEDRGV